MSDLIDNAIMLENLPEFGAPHIHGTDETHSLYVTADGVGPIRGGTGLALEQDAGTPANSFVGIGVNDENIVVVTENGLFPESTPEPAKDLGGSGAGQQSWRAVWSQRYATRVGAALSSAATIAPTHGIHHVTGTTAIDTITPPSSDFTGQVTLIMDNNGTLAVGGNIDPYSVELANLAAIAAGAGKVKLTLMYDGSVWY